MLVLLLVLVSTIPQAECKRKKKYSYYYYNNDSSDDDWGYYSYSYASYYYNKGYSDKSGSDDYYSYYNSYSYYNYYSYTNYYYDYWGYYSYVPDYGDFDGPEVSCDVEELHNPILLTFDGVNEGDAIIGPVSEHVFKIKDSSDSSCSIDSCKIFG